MKTFPLGCSYVMTSIHCARIWRPYLFCVWQGRGVGFFTHEYISLSFASMKRRKIGKVLHYLFILISSQNFIFL